MPTSPLLNSQFEREMAALGPAPARLLLAWSGGPDSTALFWLLNDWCRRRGKRLFAAHANHRLRGRASDGDEAFVRETCRRGKVPCAAARVAVRGKTAVEEKARTARYKFLARAARRFGCAWVFTAHTADDQAETVLMNLIRGAGTAGLAGMSALDRWPFPGENRLRLARPLLQFSKDQLRRHLAAERRKFRTDASNARPVFFRNRLRPLVRSWEKQRPGFLSRLGRLTRILRDEEAFWSDHLSRAARRVFRRSSVGRVIDRRGFLRYNLAVQRRLLKLLFPRAGFEAVERLRLFIAGDLDPSEIHAPGGRCRRRGNRVHCELWQKK